MQSGPDGMDHPTIETMGQALASTQLLGSLSRLLEIGAIEREPVEPVKVETLTPESPMPEGRYAITPFGFAIVVGHLAEIGLDPRAPQPEPIKRWLESQGEAE